MSGVTDRDMGYDSLMAELRELGQAGNPRVYVGILQDKGSETTEDGITLAGYAAVNEFGSSDGHVPERSFLRSTVADNKNAYDKEIEESIAAFIDAAIKVAGGGNRVLEYKLGRLGLLVTRDVQNKIRDLKAPPNAPSTLARKYPGQNPLIHTGRMRQSISHKVEMKARESAA